jgi:glycosyltransferase involved in cell wall biosynthesis
MIVKNEEKVIERSLFSCMKLVDYYVICDTGSTDNTIQVIQNFFKKHNLKGEVHQHEWKNFAHNRNLSLEIAKKKGDFIFWMDADDIIEYEVGFKRPGLHVDAYMMTVKNNDIEYKRMHLVRSTCALHWSGVVHEALNVNNKTYTDLENVKMVIVGGGGERNTDPKKYEKDAALLEQALIEEPNHTRYMFYCGQSHKNAGNLESALKWYVKRAEFENFPEERCYAMYQVGLIKLSLLPKYSYQDILFHFLQAHSYFPQRVEPLYYAVMIMSMHKLYDAAYNMAVKYLVYKQPSSECILFTENDIYSYHLPFEVAFAAYYSNRVQEALLIYRYLEKFVPLSSEQMGFVKGNIQACENKIGKISTKDLLKQVHEESVKSLFLQI